MADFLSYLHTRIFAAAAPGAGLPIHKTLFNGTTSITPRRAAGAFRLTFSFAGDTTLSTTMTDGTSTKTTLLANGATFPAGVLQQVTIPFSKLSKATSGGTEAALTFDWIQGTNVAIDSFLCEEIGEAVS